MSTIEKLKARIWLCQEELAFATRIEKHTKEECERAQERAEALRVKITEAEGKAKALREQLAVKPEELGDGQGVGADDLEEAQILMIAKLKAAVAEVEEKRSEILEEMGDIEGGLEQYHPDARKFRNENEEVRHTLLLPSLQCKQHPTALPSFVLFSVASHSLPPPTLPPHPASAARVSAS